MRIAQKGQYPRMLQLNEDIMNQKQRTRGSWIYRAHYWAAVLIVALLTTTALCIERASARDQSATAEEQQVCTPDVFRFCSSRIPDPDAIAACLKAKLSSLSDQCRYVISVRDAAKANARSK